MAFNPFEAFSVRSKLGKSVMAILGIVVMLTFVLSTGAVGSKNDFFDQMISMFGGKGSGEVVATAHGDKIRDIDLTEIGRQRRAANTYMQEATAVSHMNAAKSLAEDLKGSRLTADTKRDIERFVSLKVNSQKDMQAYRMFLFSLTDFQRFNPESQKLMQAMSRARAKPESDDKKAMDTIAGIILHDMRQTPLVLVELGDSSRDMLDFYLLLKKADQLGIHFSKAGILELMERDTGGPLKQEDRLAIDRLIRENNRLGEFSPEWLMKAIGNEYRARSALAALQGESPVTSAIRQQRASSMLALVLGVDLSTSPLPGALATASAQPGALTPAEFFEFFKDRCSEHTFAMIELSAESFLDKVTVEPTPKERNDLFNKYRGELPDPSRDRPGFKEPRKLKIDFVTLDATAPRIEQAMPKVKAADAFLWANAAALSGNPMAALITASRPAIAESMPVKQALADQMDANLSRYTAVEQFMYSPRDVSVYRPQPLASLIAGFGGYPTLTSAVAANSLAFRQIEAHDLKTRVPFLLQAWLMPFSPTMGNALGMPAFSYALNPKLPPEGVYLPEIVKDLKKRDRQQMFDADVKQLNTKLMELTRDASPFGAKVDKTKLDKSREESKKYIAEWLKDRKLTALGTKTAVDQNATVTDPDLKLLNALAVTEPDGTNSLTKKLFAMFDPRSFGGAGAPFASVQPFQPDWFPADPAGDGLDKPNHLVWVSEDVEVRGYNSLENANKLTNGEMTKRVDREWKLEKARALAKAKAEEVAEQVRTIAKTIGTNPTGVEKQLRDLALRDKFRLFDIENLAILKLQPGATAAKITYEDPKIEKQQVLYPSDNFAGQLLEMRRESLGSVKVLQDAPRARYYVACEVDRAEKTIDQFRNVFGKVTAAGPANDPLFDRYALAQEREKARETVFARLRAEAKLDEKDALKKGEKRDSE